MTTKKDSQVFTSVEQIYDKYLPRYSFSKEKEEPISGKAGVKIAKTLLTTFERKIHNPKPPKK